MNLSNKALAALGVAGLLGVVALTVPVVAQDSDDRPSVKELRLGFAARLAEELDLPVARVEEALATVREDLANAWRERANDMLQQRLSDAVESGDLTQEQADAIMEAVESGVFPGPPGHRQFRPLHGPGFHGRGGFPGLRPLDGS